MDVELTEAWLCGETGISRERLRVAREKNLSAADWGKGARGQIVWELSGLERLRGEFAEFAGILEKFSAGAAGAEKALTAFTPVGAVVRRKFANPRLIEATGPENAVIRVWVRDSANFTPGMKIRVLPPKVKNSPWRLEGKCPRWPGRF